MLVPVLTHTHKCTYTYVYHTQTPNMPCWLALTQAAVITEEGPSVEEMTPSDWPVFKSVGEFSLLMIDIGGPILYRWLQVLYEKAS